MLKDGQPSPLLASGAIHLHLSGTHCPEVGALSHTQKNLEPGTEPQGVNTAVNSLES